MIDTAEHYEPRHARRRAAGRRSGSASPGSTSCAHADGEFRVLEDNLMTPSGFAYAAAAARGGPAPRSSRRPARRRAARRAAARCSPRTLRAAAAAGREPYLVVLTDGPDNSAHWEHAWAARAARRAAGRRPATWPAATGCSTARSPSTRVPAHQRRPARHRRRPAAAPAVRAGTLGVVNAFGCGVGDDKLTHAYVEEMVRFYLGEEPLLRSVPTLDLARPDHLERALDTFAELVIKPRAGHGGIGVMICPHAEPPTSTRARDACAPRRTEWVAQPFVELSTHPTLVDGALAPRHVDLRPFVFLHAATTRACCPAA